MESSLLFLAACLMFSGVRGDSQSMSCSTVNGKTICNKESNAGNAAMASSMSGTGFGNSDYQSTYAGAGYPNQWSSSSQTVSGGSPGYNNPSLAPSSAPSTGIFGGPTGSSSYSSSGSPIYFAGPGVGGFAGGFAAAGNFPPLPFFSGFGYPQQGSSSSFSSSSSSSSPGGAPNQGGYPNQGANPGYVAPVAVPTNPFAFVNGFMGGAPFGGVGAGAGAFAFGRR